MQFGKFNMHFGRDSINKKDAIEHLLIKVVYLAKILWENNQIFWQCHLNV